MVTNEGKNCTLNDGTIAHKIDGKFVAYKYAYVNYQAAVDFCANNGMILADIDSLGVLYTKKSSYPEALPQNCWFWSTSIQYGYWGNDSNVTYTKTISFADNARGFNANYGGEGNALCIENP